MVPSKEHGLVVIAKTALLQTVSNGRQVSLREARHITRVRILIRSLVGTANLLLEHGLKKPSCVEVGITFRLWTPSWGLCGYATSILQSVRRTAKCLATDMVI